MGAPHGGPHGGHLASARSRSSRSPASCHSYRMLRYGQDYVDVGEQAYEARFAARRLASLKEAARGLGFTLVREPLADG